MVVLATKCYVDGDARERALDGLGSLIQNAVGDLDVTYEVGLRDDDFPSVTVEGEDAVAARNLLREEWGAITTDFEAGETYVGTLESWDEDGFVLDAGQAVRIPADEIGLGQGSPEQIRKRFGLVQHLPLEFVWDDSPRLSDDQRDDLYDWTRGTGRVNVNSATRAEVRATVNRAGHAQDIVTVERQGLLEQSVICKEGTDPPGLLASIGKHLPSEILAVVP
ncbi:hypothetical protein SAMN05216388_1010169 [Halorientalis persicus]|jgi:hypothetical protein|uniref:DUF2110 domain-containing protein n=1 Tax=Halorientalis persicus TaxID=1367881 RepID=A0A1H8NIH0_9EURY|nr:DUF2110 family protein [Halorientalis persicus]SEO29356.1 hypothetical protein SAMN05216388_1010169 [Halorientalis persicus]